MRHNLSAFTAAVLGHPMGIFWLITMVVVVWMNAKTGYEIGGDSVGLALVMGSIAVLAAYAVVKQATVTGVRRWGLWCLVVLQLGFLGQFAGWQTMGLTMARGEGSLESKAAARGTIADKLAQLRAERASLGTPRPASSIQTEADLECSKRKGGVGDRCTTLRSELGRAERVVAIDAEIPVLVAKLTAGEKLGDSGAGYAVPVALANAVGGLIGAAPVTQAHVRFGFEVFVVFLLEFVATLGPWLLGMGVHGGGRVAKDDVAGDADDDAARFDPADLPRVPPRLPSPARRVEIAARPGNPPRAAGDNGTTNIINVGPSAQVPVQRLPPRVAARRA